MKTEKEEIVKLLLDIKFNGSQNEFEEFYGDCVTYKEVEQESYQDLKYMVEEAVGKTKFRKARDISGDFFLTCKLEMRSSQFERFMSIYEGRDIDFNKTNNLIENPSGKLIYKKFKFLHNFIIDNVRLQSVEDERRALEIEKNKKLEAERMNNETEFDIISIEEYNEDDDLKINGYD